MLFVIKTLSLAGGGAERVLAAVTSALAGRGHHVTILSFDPEQSKDFYAVSTKVRRTRLQIGGPDKPSGIRTIWSRLKAIREFAKESSPDVAVGFMHSAYIPLGLALAGTQIPAVASEHIVYDHYRTLPLQALLLRVTAGLFTRFTTISERVRQSFPKSIAKRMVVIPNPVTAPAHGCASTTGTRDKLLLSVGRLTRQKDHETLIAAFGRLAAKYAHWRLRILGEGELRPELERQVARLGLGNRVELPGTTADIGREYAEAQLFVMPSLYESFGLATAEALAHGLPVVGFADCPGTNELIEDGVNGLLVEGPDRVAAFAAGLDRLMSSSEDRLRMGAAGPPSIVACGLDAIVGKWEELLTSVAAAARKE